MTQAMAIDPRIRERRVSVARVAARRRLRVLLAITAAVMSALGVDLVAHSALLSVDHVDFAGLHQTPLASAEAALAGQAHRPMVDLDSSALAARLEALPWVASVSVTKRWPTTVSIRLSERVAVAQVASGSGWALVDATGRVLASLPTPQPGLVRLIGLSLHGGPGGTLPALSAEALAVARVLPAGLAARVQDVAQAPDGTLSVHLAGAVTVAELGPADQLSAKLSALQTVLNEVDMSGVKIIDLRLPDQPALTRG